MGYECCGGLWMLWCNVRMGVCVDVLTECVYWFFFFFVNLK